MRNLLLCLALAGLPGVVATAPVAYAAADAGVPDETPYLIKPRAEIKAKQYAQALAELKVIVTQHQNADVYTLLGHALWKTGDREQGMTYYNKALALYPNHRGALEYQGELYVAMGQMDKARANLAKLKAICQAGCEESNDLYEAIEHAPKGS
jgi:Flp pilus assembly protein TadD